MATDYALAEPDRQRLDGIVQQMVGNREPDANIQTVVNDFKQKYGKGSVPPAPAPKKGLGGRVFDTLTGAGRAVADFVGAGPVADEYATKIAEIGQSPERQALIEQTAPTPRQVAGSAAMTGLGLLPFGRIATAVGGAAKAVGIGAKVAKPLGEALTSVGAGYGFDVASKNAEGKTGAEAFKPGVGTAIGATLPGAAAVSGLVRKAAPSAASRTINSLIKPLLKDFSYGKNPGRTVSELGITGNSLDDLGANISQARQKIGQSAQQLGAQLDPKVKVTVSGPLSAIDRAMVTAANNNDKTVLERLQDVKKALTKVLLPVSDPATGEVSIATARDRQLHDLTYTQALKIKQQIGKLTKFTGNASDDKTVNVALKTAYGGVKEALDKAATAVDPQTAAQLRKLNEQYADLQSAEIATEYRDKIAARQNLISLPAGAAGIGAAIITAISTGGAAIPALLAGASGVALEKALATPAVKTRVAAALAKIKPAEADGLFNKLPFLKGFEAPGDKFLKTETGKKLGDYLKNAQPGLSMKAVDIHPDDLHLMHRFIDYARIKEPISDSEFHQAEILAQHFGITMDKGLSGVANAFEKVLDGTAPGKSTVVPIRDTIGRFAPKK